MSRALLVGISFLIGIVAAISVTPAQTAAPKDNKGLKVTRGKVIDLGPEITGMEGRQLRMNIFEIGPGGHVAMHTHKDRPAVVYYLQGTLKVISSDGTSKTFHAGDTSSSTKDTMHWAENEGTEPVIMIAADIFHPKK